MRVLTERGRAVAQQQVNQLDIEIERKRRLVAGVNMTESEKLVLRRQIYALDNERTKWISAINNSFINLENIRRVNKMARHQRSVARAQAKRIIQSGDIKQMIDYVDGLVDKITNAL
jgi:hypothetical protein